MQTVSRKSKQLASPCINLIISSFCFFLFTVFLVSSVYAVNDTIEISLTQTADNNLALNPERSELSDELYSTFSKVYDYLNRTNSDFNGTDLGTITSIEAFIEYYTVSIDNDYTYLGGRITANHFFGIRKLNAKPVEGTLYFNLTFATFPTWSELAGDGVRMNVGSYYQVGGPDGGSFYIDKIGYRVNYTKYLEINLSMIYSKLLEIEEEITSVNETVKDESAQIQTNQEEIYDLLQDLDFGNVGVDISVGSTYHLTGETANIFAKVSEEGQAVEDAFCDVLIFAPNGTEIDGFQLNYINNSRGVYANTIVVPNEIGVYIVDVQCFRPFNESHQIHYFAGDGTPAYDLYFLNTSGSTETNILLPDVPDGVYQCHPDRWSQSFTDFEDGTFESFRFLGDITNISIWAEKNIGVAKDYTFVLRFYKQTDKGEMTLGAVLNTTSLTMTPEKIVFHDTSINEPFDRYSLLEVEFCVHGVGEFGKDVTIYFNGTEKNSSFVINTIDIEAPVDFIIGGSAGLNVKNYTYFDEKFIETWLNQQEIYSWLQDFNVTVDNWLNNVFTNQQEILNAISNITFNDTAILESITNLNSTVMNKIYLLQDDIASVNSAVISARADILNQMIVNYNSLVSILNNLPTNILGSFEQQTPNWFKCIAQKLTGVYPAGSEC